VLSTLKQWARVIKRDVVALWIAAGDPRVPWHVKVAAGAVAAYALSPIDLIPDFIPVLGYLDDLIIVPIGILLVVRMVPEPLMEEFRMEAARREARPNSYVGLFIIVALWLIFGWWAASLLWPQMSNFIGPLA
jgi:uncharacterized membrane protein YkvA (DUF1232 family)